MLGALRAAGDHARFHPHQFTDAALGQLARRRGRDYYCILVVERSVLGYGMLRGWDEGYKTPRLGIALHPSAHRKGHARALMRHLHGEARRRGADCVELKVREDNVAAIALYRAMGYRFVRREGRYRIGRLFL